MMRLFLILGFVFLGTSTKYIQQLVIGFLPINKAELNLRAFFHELASLKRFNFVNIIKKEDNTSKLFIT